MMDQGRLPGLFEALLRKADLPAGKAALRRSRPPTGVGLFAAADIREQEAVLAVPTALCIVEPRELPEGVAPGDLPPSFTWDVRLAVKLLEAVEGRWSPFWTEYAGLLPPAESMAQPSLLPRTLLAELQHPHAVIGAQAQQQRLRALFPELVPAEDAPAAAYPSPFLRAFALARSRSFAAGDDHFAAVPFLDLVNIDPTPNVDIQFVPEERRFYLRTLRRVAKGEEFLLPSPPLDNQKHFARFGWVEPGGNAFDTLPGLGGGPSLSRKLFWESLKSSGLNPDDLFSLSPYVRATLQSLPLAEEAPTSEEAEARAVRRLQTLLGDVQAAEFKTTVEADVQLVHQLRAGGPVTPDPRLLPIVLYRVERKTLIATALRLLAAHEQRLRLPPA